MASGGKKRTRSERVAALELPPGKWERAWGSLHRVDVLMRISLAVATALVLCFVIRGWQTPFPYRPKYTPSRDITARVPFSVEDVEETRKKKDRAQWRVRYVYVQDPEPLVRLRDLLGNTVKEVRAAPTFADLTNREVWYEFLPQPEKDQEPTEQEAEEQFNKFHEILVGDEGLARFEQAVADALAPFEQRGLLKKLEQNLGEGDQDEIIVYEVGKRDWEKVVKVSDVLIGDGAALRESLEAQFESADLADVIDPVFAWIRRHPTETLSVDEDVTKAALKDAVAGVKPEVYEYTPGQSLAKAGEPLTPEQIDLLRLEHDQVNAQRSLGQELYRTAATLTFVLALFTFYALYLYARQQRLLGDLRQLALVAAMAVITVGLSGWAAAEAWRAEIIPLLLFGQIITIAYRRELGLLTSGAVALIVVLALGQGFSGFLILWGVTTTVILQLGHIRSRSKLISVGFFGALAALGLTLIVRILDNQPVGKELLIEAAFNGLWTLAAGFLMTGLLPFIERLFGVLTDMSLLELGDVSHPLCQELVRRAPSTYNHSITVGSIAEAAADAIGARGLLVRVGAYFHDIGKMLKPAYFIENQPPDDNRHEALVPQMSTLVIVAHIKDGADLARQHKLPNTIIDFIQQHHGTTLVEYFYGRASEQQQSDPNGGDVEESTFRYPGPKPQTKEAGVLMLADAVESACRSLVEPGSARIESLVREIAERKLQDGQFDESGLTLRELRTIEDSMIKSLIAHYHGRIKYPDQRTA